MTDEDRALAFNELITVSKESISKEEGSSVSFYQHKNDSFYLKSKAGNSEPGDPRYLLTPDSVHPSYLLTPDFHPYRFAAHSPDSPTSHYTGMPLTPDKRVGYTH